MQSRLGSTGRDDATMMWSRRVRQVEILWRSVLTLTLTRASRAGYARLGSVVSLRCALIRFTVRKARDAVAMTGLVRAEQLFECNLFSMKVLVE